jgi:hypothetical protein
MIECGMEKLALAEMAIIAENTGTPRLPFGLTAANVEYAL